MVNSDEPIQRRGSWGRPNEFYNSNPQHSTANFGVASPGNKIDIQSIRIEDRCINRGERFLVNVSELGFQINSSARNSGYHNKGLGIRDGRGCAMGDVSWTEIKTTQHPATIDLGSGELEWGKSKSFSLPEQVTSILVKVKQIDGQEIILNQPSPSKWFSVSQDAARQSLVLSSFDLRRAMQ